MLRRKRFPLGLGIGLLGLAACSSVDPVEHHRLLLEEGVALYDEGRLPEAAGRMNEILSETQASASEYPLQRFYAFYVLARIHAAASMAEPFFIERTTAASRIGGIGRRGEGARPDERPSITGHLVASVFHASQARSLYDDAARSGPKRDGVARLPDELWSLGVDNADANLQIVLTSAFSRLEFEEEVEKTLESSPDLLVLEPCLEYLERYDVQPELRPWICEMIYRYLRERDEEAAYRFGVAAIESEQHFGLPLPPDVVASIEDWILNGASVRFVCPESQTPYLPGQRRSPVSGIPHSEYIAVERLDDEG